MTLRGTIATSWSINNQSSEKRRFMKNVLNLLICMFACSSCVSQAHIAEVAANVKFLNQEEHERLTKALGGWIGHTGDEVITNWGAPSSIASLQSGGRVLTYVLTRTSFSYFFPQTNFGIQPSFGVGRISNPTGLPSTINQIGMSPVDTSTSGHWDLKTLSCRANLTLDKKDIIRSWTMDQAC